MPSLAAHVGYNTVETLQSAATSTVKAYTVCVAVERGDLCCTAVSSTRFRQQQRPGISA